jgi:hypothetical protein
LSIFIPWPLLVFIICFISSFLPISFPFLSPNFCSLKVLYCCRVYKYFITENGPTIISKFYAWMFVIYKLSGHNLFLFRIILSKPHIN